MSDELDYRESDGGIRFRSDESAAEYCLRARQRARAIDEERGDYEAAEYHNIRIRQIIAEQRNESK